MPWISRRDYEAMIRRNDELVDKLAVRREQLRDLRRAVHRLAHEQSRVANELRREATISFDKTVQNITERHGRRPDG